MDLSRLDFRGMIDASPNPYLVLDRDLHIAFANRAYLRGVRRDLADLVGRWAWEAFPTDPETEAQAIASFKRHRRAAVSLPRRRSDETTLGC